MNTNWSYEYNKNLARTAEQVGFDYALAQARFFGSYGADKQLEALSVANALAANTEKLRLIGAVHPGQWNPGPIANFVATSDHISNGRFHLNVVSGWFKDEYTRFGEPWLEHDERYDRSEEFIKVLKDLWTEEQFSFNGRFYQIDNAPCDAPCEPKPVSSPDIFQGGNSPRALKMAARVSDWLFLNGGSLEKLKSQIEQVNTYAKEFGTTPPKIGVNSFVIARDTETEAKPLEKEKVLA